MKTISSSDMQTRVEAILSSAQSERIVLTRRGRPSAVLIGIESYDDEDLQLARSKDFWRMIEQRRQGSSISLAELKSRLNLNKPARTRKSTAKSPGTRRGRSPTKQVGRNSA
jgi:prevent-host-death family protein